MKILLVSTALLAGPAWADTAPAAPHLDLSRLQSPYAQDSAHAADAALRDAGYAKTAAERRFSHAQASAALGFLCGRQPSAVNTGGAAAYGVDPQGRFLGAQLRMSFR